MAWNNSVSNIPKTSDSIDGSSQHSGVIEPALLVAAVIASIILSATDAVLSRRRRHHHRLGGGTRHGGVGVEEAQP